MTLNDAARCSTVVRLVAMARLEALVEERGQITVRDWNEAMARAEAPFLLRELRRMARLTQGELALRAGLTTNTVHLAERPDAPAPSFRTQRRVAEVLEVDAETIWPTIQEEAAA